MKQVLFLFLVVSIMGCTTVEVIDEWKNLDNAQWKKSKPVELPIVIKDTSYYYNLYVNLRVTNEYKYSNLWVKVFITDPEGKTTTDQTMLSLADHRGKWNGHNLGHIISFRLPIQKDKVFSKAGKYYFKVQQYMRDTVLKEVVSVGIKLDKQQQILK